MNFEPNFQILLCRCCANSVKENCSQLIISQLQFYFVALEGFEPSQAEPESDVLPLHHKAGWLGLFPFCECKVTTIFLLCQIFFKLFFISVQFFVFGNLSTPINAYF